MKKELEEAYFQALATPGTKIPIGRIVVCDVCLTDYTDSHESGGVLIGSYAYCPTCAGQVKPSELHQVRARCPMFLSFADWVRKLRGPGAGITVTAGVPK